MASAVAPARLLTLGRLALLDGEGRPLLPPESTKLLGLLAYLAAAPGRRATRERLIDLFWDDRSLPHARGSLRQAFHRLRETLGEEYLPAGSSDVLLTPALACDRDEFLAAIAAGTLDEALNRYGGPFVPGFVTRGGAAFEQWRDQERGRLQHLFAATAESVAQRALEAGDPKRASTIAARLLADQPLNERAWRLRLQAEQAAGSQVHLIASITEFRNLLASERWQPEARTLRLLQSLERPLETGLDDSDAAQLITDLVGRGPVVALLHDAWREATRRHGVHVHLTGGAGLGKTRVMEDFAVRLRAEKRHVARARALPRQRLVPGAMLASLIGVLAELPGAKGISEHSARILLGLQPAISTRFLAAVPLEITQSDARFLAQLEALDDLIGAVSHDDSVCLLLDDVHWWDELSRRTIEHAIERLDGRSVLVVTASRPGPGELTATCTREKIFLSPLTHNDVVVLLQSLGGHPDDAAIERLAAGLQRAAAGVPLLVLEAIRLGLDRNLLGLADQQWDLDRLEQFLAILHPGRLLNERLATLTAAQTHLLLVAWLAEFPVVADDMAAIDRANDTGALLELERLGFLTSTHAGWVVTHDAIGEAVESAASAEARQLAYRAAGVLTRRRGAQGALLGQAAKLFLEADAQDELLETASVWLRQQRAERSTAPAAVLIGDLLGASAGPLTIRALVDRLPRSLRRTPWTAMRLAPMWAVAGAVVVAGTWWASTSTPPPDAILGVIEQGPDGKITESRIELRQSSWAASNYHMVITRRTHVSEWGAVFDSRNTDPTKDPTSDRLVWSRVLRSEQGTNGPTDLKLRQDGVTRPLSPAPGDDVGPSWSPDGRFVAFSTTRWSPKADPNFDIGIVEVATGEVRQLTRGPDTDKVPYWSPDGTRIGFLHRSEQLAPDSLCWVTTDGLKRQCRSVTGGQIDGLIGWIDYRTMAVVGRQGGASRIEFDTFDGGPDRVVELSPKGIPRISPDRIWLARIERRPVGRDAGVSLFVSQVARPGMRRGKALSSEQAAPAAFVYWEQPPANRGLVELTIVRSRDTITAATNTPFRLAVEGGGATGKLMPLPSEVISWGASDTAVATVDTLGDVRGRAPGVVTITASAGGWRRARIQLIVRPDPAKLVSDEQWRQDWGSGWDSWGTPLPRLVHLPGGLRAMLPNGDGVYSSGLQSKQRFDVRHGLALDVEVSTPITRPKWQFLRLWIAAPGVPTFSGPGGPQGCSLGYPNGEGWLASMTMAGVPVDTSLATGKWYRLRVQLFPDGSCGYALNGRAIQHTPDVLVVADSMVVALGGQTVASDLLVGRVRVWSGVPEDVDWGPIGTKAVRTAGPRATPPHR